MVAAAAPRPEAAQAERWASLDDPYVTGYAPSFEDGGASYAAYAGGTQLIDPGNAVSGLSGSLWTSRAGESLASGARSGPVAVNASARIKPSELSTLTYRDNAPGSAKSPRSGKGLTPKLLTSAFALAGTPFRQGQNSPKAGFDNAGYVGYVYSQAGVRLPRGRSAAELVAAGKPVSKDELRPGDMVVYNDPKNGNGYLVGVYSGSGNFLLASPRLNVVTETAAFGTDYGPYFVGGRRLYDDPNAAPLSDGEKMSVTNGAVMTALSQLGDIPRMQGSSSPSSYKKAKGKSSRSKGKSRSVSSKGKGKKAYAKGKAKASSKGRKAVARKRRS
jgi:cell wall-associated NlpC family hydrolase